MAHKKPIFLHAGFRTGGTALAFAFRESRDVMMFYDPLSPALELKSLNFGPSDWASNHPLIGNYFEEYVGILDDYLRIVPSIYKVRFDYEGRKSNRTFISMIDFLIATAEKKNCQAVFKFETSEGRILALKNEYPTSLHIGLVRDLKQQERSWMQMAERGEYGFYHAAWKLIALNPEIFGTKAKTTFLSSKRIWSYFTYYEEQRRSLLKFCDLIIDISDESDIANLQNLLAKEGISKLDSSTFLKLAGESQTVNNAITCSKYGSRNLLKKLQLFLNLSTTLLKRSYFVNQSRRILVSKLKVSGNKKKQNT